jgi:hypothetical protein
VNVKFWFDFRRENDLFFLSKQLFIMIILLTNSRNDIFCIIHALNNEQKIKKICFVIYDKFKIEMFSSWKLIKKEIYDIICLIENKINRDWDK